MSSKNTRLRFALVALAVTVAGLAAAGPAAAAAPRTTAQTATVARTAAIPVDFVDLTTSPLPADTKGHKVTVTYRNDSAAPLTVAPQLLVESPDAGPFLAPSDLTVERRTAAGCWEPVELGTQTGTLFTDLTTAQRTLAPGATLTETYRVTVTTPGAQGTLHPRVALYA
ncbi:signal peptide protein [Streptomyces sp. NPDC101112]|uniref:signal peptide protein n=1 Tax=Streptomyces sp. NPDC101112 TaxID=3366105 RepID=UPI00382647B8